MIHKRKMIMEIARLGCGFHPDRFVMYTPLKEGEKVSEGLLKFIEDLADIHYEVDFIIGSTAKVVNHKLKDDEDNIYIVPNMSEDNHQFLLEEARVVLSNDKFAAADEKELKANIKEDFVKENFTRDEFSKQAKFKITHGHPNTGHLK